MLYVLVSLTRGLNERRRGRRKVGVSIFSVLDTAEWSSGMVHNAQTSQSSVQEFEVGCLFVRQNVFFSCTSMLSYAAFNISLDNLISDSHVGHHW